jgi:uncharacterized OsmC-like protein
MPVDIDLVYEGGLRCRAVHGPSGTALVTDAPVDNHGRGASFSPTDLVATALGTCVATTLGIFAEGAGLDVAGLRVHVQKAMTTAGVRRIARLDCTVTVPAAIAAPLDAATRRRLERVAEACPVKLSLRDEVEAPIGWVWEA